MKKSIIGLLCVGALMLATTSCSDIFDINSNRVVYEKYNSLDSSADSVYSIIGILQGLQELADRYVILGELRGDMVDVNDLTKTSLRNISEFNFEDDNEYLQVRDYYNVINNCNYLLTHMDTTIRHNNEAVMVDEYVAALSIRAWTYLQLAINYGKVPYYTNPVTTVAEAEADYPMYDVKDIARELIPQLLPYMKYKMPIWPGLTAGSTTVTNQIFPPIELILGDLYLWLGDYQNAWNTYFDYLTDNPDYYMTTSTGNRYEGFLPLGPGQFTTTSKQTTASYKGSALYTSYLTTIMGKGSEALCIIPMQATNEDGKLSEVPSLFYSTDGTHQLVGSELWYELSEAQDYIYTTSSSTALKKNYSILEGKGDQRAQYYTYKYQTEENEYTAIRKFQSGSKSNGTEVIYTTNFIVLYRRAGVYLRAAEALNRLAYQTHDAEKAMKAFGILRDGFDFLLEAYPSASTYKEDIQPNTLGVHARGCGDVYLDTASYVVKDEVIAKFYDKEIEELTFKDTIDYVEDRIVNEIALEMTFEGNRFTDLVRIAEHRGPEYLAKKIASRKGTENFDEALYQKLLDKQNWYLPLE